METLSVAFNDSYDVLCFDLYLINKLGRYTIYKGKMQRRYVQTDTLLIISYCWRSKFITKI